MNWDAAQDGRAALHSAARWGRVEIVASLMALSADVGIIDEVRAACRPLIVDVRCGVLCLTLLLRM